MNRRLKSLILILLIGLCINKIYAQSEIALSDFKKVSLLSGDINYYRILTDEDLPYIHAEFSPEMKTSVIGYEFPSSQKINRIGWDWRVKRFPQGADERVEGKSDSPAAVYLFFTKGLTRYTLKYVYSTQVPVGSRFEDKTINPFFKLWVIVLCNQKTASLKWVSQSVDFKKDFQKCYGFAAPDIKGIGLLTDGDGTQSYAVADYRQFWWQ